MTDCNLRSKKTIKQFLQPRIEQVFGGGGGGGVVDVSEGCAAFLASVFPELLYFCVGFFQFTDAFFWVDFTDICIFFVAYYVYFIKKSVSLAENFRDVQFICSINQDPASLHGTISFENLWLLCLQVYLKTKN